MWKRRPGRTAKAPPDESGERISPTYDHRATSQLHERPKNRREGDPGALRRDAGRVRSSLRIQRSIRYAIRSKVATAGRADTRLSSRDRARSEGSAEGFAGCVMRSQSTPKRPFASICALPYDGRIFGLLFLNSSPLDARLTSPIG